MSTLILVSARMEPRAMAMTATRMAIGRLNAMRISHMKAVSGTRFQLGPR